MAKGRARPGIQGPDGFIETFSVSRETAERLQIYERLLRQWQGTINLVASGTLDHIWHRHFADSAQLRDLVPTAARTLVDVGSGGGFPGLVLAILFEDAASLRRPAVTLVESDQRKAAFLREVARQLGVSVDILSIRIENRETQRMLSPVDVVTARALAPLWRLLTWVAPLVGPESVALFPKGRDVAAEVEDARSAFRFEVDLVPSVTEPDGRIAVIRHIVARTEV